MTIAIYNFVPAYFFGSRFALLENILVPAVLLHLIILYQAFGRKKLFWFGLAGFLGGMLFLVKESGIGFTIGSLILMRLNKSNLKQFKTFIIFSLLPILLYIIWGMFLSAEVFWKILLFNSSRQFWGSINFMTMFTSLRFRDFPFDGWWMLGFISVFYLSIKKTIFSNLWIIPVVTHLFLVLFMGGQNYSWYYLTLAPFLALASALFIYELYIFPKLPQLAVFFLFALSSSLYWGRAILQHTPSVLEYRLLLFTTGALGIINNIVDNKKFLMAWRIFIIVVLISAMLLNYRSLTYLMTNWSKDYPSLPPT